MIVSKKSVRSKQSKHPIILTYFLSNASNPEDKLIFDGKDIGIYPGLQVTIPKNTNYRIKSSDLDSYRVYQKKK